MTLIGLKERIWVVMECIDINLFRQIRLSPRELIHNGGAGTALASLGIAAERTIAADSRDGVPG